MIYKFGKLPAKHDPRTFAWTNFVKQELPEPPEEFGHDKYIIDSFKMLGNDRYGCCVEVGMANAVRLFNAAFGKEVDFSEENVLSEYSKITAFDPKTGANDGGTVMLDAAKYWRKHGIKDVAGKTHKILAFIKLEPGNVDQLLKAVYFFGCALIGIQLTDTAINQFNRGEIWDGSEGIYQGGHLAAVVSKRQRAINCVTWAKEQKFIPEFYKKFSDEAIVPLSLEYLDAECSPEGLNMPELIKALKSL